ncbi:hypothetical protein BH11MYX4_BH11MYX4_01360 [soil metagenome]
MTRSGLTAEAPGRTHPGRAANIALWVVQILLALAFIGAASGKLLGKPEMVGLYEAIGVGQWFRHVTELLELTGAILVVVPRTKFFGAALLGTIMVGAALTHLLILHNAPTAPAVLFLLAAIVAWGRRAALKPALARLGLVAS